MTFLAHDIDVATHYCTQCGTSKVELQFLQKGIDAPLPCEGTLGVMHIKYLQRRKVFTDFMKGYEKMGPLTPLKPIPPRKPE